MTVTAAEGTRMNNEMARVVGETRGKGVTVNGWQEGTGNVSGFAMVSDKTTRTTFGVKAGEPLADAMGRARARMAAGSRNSVVVTSKPRRNRGRH